MNAIGLAEAAMARGPSALTRVAEYLRGMALAGRGCPSNPSNIAQVLGLSLSAVRNAREVLITSGRLEAAWNTYRAIDGIRFGAAIADDEVEAVKTILRKRCGVVFDRRTVDDPKAVAEGPPRELEVNGRVVTWDQAVAMAKRLGAR